LRDWRWPLYGLVAYIPFAGIPIDAAYSHRFERAVAILAKDYLFVLPAYAGFLVWALARKGRLSFPGAPVLPLLAFAVVVLGQAFNPAVPKPLMAVIGIKVWLLYVPLLFLGYHFARTRRELYGLLGLASVGALLPALIGIVEAVVVYAGDPDWVYSLYGNAASAVTQEFTQFDVGKGLRRIPSTFASYGQYYLFLSCIVAFAYAWWRGRERRARLWSPRALLWLLVIGAAFASGQRGAFLFIPLLIAMMLALDAEPRLALNVAAAVLGVLAVFTLLVGTSVPSVLGDLAHVTRQEFGDVVVDSGREAVSLTTFGLGTGIDSVGSRYAYANDEAWRDAIDPILGRWHESWYVKTYLELGVIGFAIVLFLMGVIVVRGARAYARVRDGPLRSVGAALLALVVWTLVYGVKAQYVDLDPLNVYFWLAVGLLLKLPALEEASPESPAPAVAFAGPEDRPVVAPVPARARDD
jgi:hypothetical protein